MESCAGGPRDATAGKQAVGLICIHSDSRSPPPRRNPNHTDGAAAGANFASPKAAVWAEPVLTFVNRHLVRCDTRHVHPATPSALTFASAAAFALAEALPAIVFLPVPSKLVILDIGDL